MTALAFLIPSRDRHGELARWLPSVLRAAQRVGAAVLICDQSARPFPAPPGATVLHRPDLGGLPAARNALLAASTAGLVCFLDDDTEIAGDFATVLLALAAAEPGTVAWGPVVEIRPRAVRRLHRLAQLGVFHDPRRLLGRRRDQPTSALFGCCFAVRRAAAVATGFDARRAGYALGEDLDFCLRLRRLGGLRFVRGLRAIHHRATAGRAGRPRRGRAKGTFLAWLAHRHGGHNPFTLLHLALAIGAAASARGEEPGTLSGIMRGLWTGR